MVEGMSCNHNFNFTNNKGAFLKTIKMPIKGAKLFVIVNSKMMRAV